MLIILKNKVAAHYFTLQIVPERKLEQTKLCKTKRGIVKEGNNNHGEGLIYYFVFMCVLF